MKRSILLIMALLAAPAARAEFTPQEKTQAANQLVALDKATLSCYNLSQQLSANPSAVLGVQTACNAILDAQHKHFKFVAHLLDAAPNIHTLTRDQALATAETHRASASYASALAAINALAASCPTCNVTGARNNLQAAENFRAGFDTSLAYLDPRVQENIDFNPGTSRFVSATSGPHGDYLYSGIDLHEVNLFARDQWKTALQAATAGGVSLSWYLQSFQYYQRMHSYAGIMTGLRAGIEIAWAPAHVDQMVAGFSTQRGRQFARMQLYWEIMLGFRHQPPHNQDVFGRNVIRGMAYDLRNACYHAASRILEDTSLPADVRSWGQTIRSHCEVWAWGDAAVQDALIFRYFSNVGPPGQVHGVCGPGTELTMVEGVPTCTPAACPNCPPEITCGTGTHLEGSSCVADPVVCPTFVAELVLTGAATGEARCVEQP